ncbi:TIGR03936 family radical SAM-associated protein [Pseudonocardia sp. Cha107L01]|jgi:radical SAM-linked protein|uniref:TIGR03936 family radical SAM-associated protein n=1 Tax=Pseudonocardia sp. Cha107L01 TaxID=3457576 RepID=UPI00403E7D99
MAGKGVAPNPAPPTLCKVRVRFAKRGRLRFSSHRDVARAFERAVRRAGLPVARSHGFSPHPRLSWVGAAPTGTASEAEYLEIGLTTSAPPERMAADLDEALPVGLDILAAVRTVPGGPALAELINASQWRIELPQVRTEALEAAVTAFLAEESVIVERSTKNGPKPVDVRAAVANIQVVTGAPTPPPEGDDQATGPSTHTTGPACAIMTSVVRQTTPAVRPDDVLGALLVVAGLRPPVPAMAIRLAQGLLDDRGRLADPFDAVG